MAEDPIKDTEKAIKETNKAMEEIMKIYKQLSNVPFPHEYWSLQNTLTRLNFQLKFLKG